MFFEKSNEILIAKMANREELQAGLSRGRVRVFILKNTIDFSQRG